MSISFSNNTGIGGEVGGRVKNQDKTFTVNGEFTADEGYTGLGTVTVNVSGGATTEELTVTPTTSKQTFTPTEVDAYNKVTVNAVTNSIDANITSSNIKSGVTILGTTGTYKGSSTPIIESLSITPTTSQQTITATGDTDGYSPITVGAVTSSIDANITAENIKKDVQILGVTGTYEGSGGANLPRSIVSNSLVVSNTVSTYTTPQGATDIGNYGLAYAFINSSVLESVDASAIESITGSDSLRYTFSGSTIVSADFSNLETVSGNYAFFRAFDGSSISKFNSNTTGMAEFTQLTSISGQSSLSYIFSGCSNITSVRFPVLSSINDSSVATSSTFYGAFGGGTSGITSIYFNAITANSFNGDPFKGMFINNRNNISLHFKNNSALKTKIQGLDSYPGFGAPNSDNVTVLFDL